MYVSWFDPFATSSRWAIYTVLSRILLKFAIPFLLEVEIEKPLYMLEGYVISGTAFWRHMLWVGNRKFENATQAIVAHAMATFQLSRLGSWNVIR
jgi:hypothetical protein